MTNTFLKLRLSAIPLLFSPLTKGEEKKFSPFLFQPFLFSDSPQERRFSIRVLPPGNGELSQKRAAFGNESGGSRRYMIVKI